MQTRRGLRRGRLRHPEVPPETASRGDEPWTPPAPCPRRVLPPLRPPGQKALDRGCLTAFAQLPQRRAAPAPAGGRGLENQPGFTPESPDSRDSAGSAPSPPPGGPCERLAPAASHQRTVRRCGPGASLGNRGRPFLPSQLFWVINSSGEPFSLEDSGRVPGDWVPRGRSHPRRFQLRTLDAPPRDRSPLAQPPPPGSSPRRALCRHRRHHHHRHDQRHECGGTPRRLYEPDPGAFPFTKSPSGRGLDHVLRPP